MPQLIGVLHSSDVENKSLTALPPQLTEALRMVFVFSEMFEKAERQIGSEVGTREDSRTSFAKTFN
jgi:hypothetical protein